MEALRALRAGPIQFGFYRCLSTLTYFT